MRPLSLIVVGMLATLPIALGHSEPGTPNPLCETNGTIHDYGPPGGVRSSPTQPLVEADVSPIGVGVKPFGSVDLKDGEPFFLTGFIDGASWWKLNDCDTTTPTEWEGDRHSEFAYGGAWLLVESGDGETSGALACFGEWGHHPQYGPFTVEDAFLGATKFRVSVDAVNLGPASWTDCGDFLADASADCVGTCTVTFPPGTDGSYHVFTMGIGHVWTV